MTQRRDLVPALGSGGPWLWLETQTEAEDLPVCAGDAVQIGRGDGVGPDAGVQQVPGFAQFMAGLVERPVANAVRHVRAQDCRRERAEGRNQGLLNESV